MEEYPTEQWVREDKLIVIRAVWKVHHEEICGEDMTPATYVLADIVRHINIYIPSTFPPEAWSVLVQKHFPFDQSLADELVAIDKVAWQLHCYGSRFTGVDGQERLPVKRSHYRILKRLLHGSPSLGGVWSKFVDRNLEEITDDEIQDEISRARYEENQKTADPAKPDRTAVGRYLERKYGSERNP